MNRRSAPRPAPQRGAALLLAMLTVSLVTAFAAAAAWQQWRATEVQAAERARLQTSWLLSGAIDWTRQILQEDTRQTQADHLSEPWAVPLLEARMSSFLAAEGNTVSNSTDLPDDAFLSGQVQDMQGRFNLGNLMRQGQLSARDVQTLQRLFQELGLPAQEANQLLQQWERAWRAQQGQADPAAPLLPQRVEQLVWLGLPAERMAQLEPHLAILPEYTAINVNTATQEVLLAAAGDVTRSQVLQLVSRRNSQPFLKMDAVRELLPASGQQASLGVSSRYFLIHGRLRIGDVRIEEQALIQRDGLRSSVLWRQKDSVIAPDPAAAP